MYMIIIIIIGYLCHWDHSSGKQALLERSSPASAGGDSSTRGLPAVGGMLACSIPSCEALVRGYSNERCRN